MRKIKNLLVVVSLLLMLALITSVVLAVMDFLPEIMGSVDKMTYPLEYEEEINSASEEFSVPKEIICAVIYVESSFDKDATSHVGARGLMQIMPSTFEDINKALKTDYSEDDLYDPAVNIRAGSYYLSYLYKLLGDWELVHAAYNAGIGNVWSWLENEEYASDGKLVNIPFEETEKYLEKIEIAKEKYKELYFN